MQFPYTSKGEAVIKSLVSEEKDKLLAVASLAELGKYIPDIDAATNVDLLGIAFNALVANRFNKNDDVSDSETSVALAKLFVRKPINIEHRRDRVVGVILSYAFTQFGTNKPLTEEEALATKDPFNVTLGGVVWRVVNQKLAKLIEECSDPTSDYYEKVSASWEIGFLDFAVAAVKGDSRNLEDAEIITSQDEIKALKDYMKAFGGKGSKGDRKLYRLIKGDALPLGIGLTGSPAAEVLGIATYITNDEEAQKEKEEPEVKLDKQEEVSAKTKEIETEDKEKQNNSPTPDKNTENISQNKEKIVIQERKALAMKINKIEDITDDLLKQTAASEVTEWVKSQLQVANDEYQAEKTKLETQIQASKEAADKLSAEHAKVQEDLKKVTETLAALQAEKEARIKQDTFNVRMASLDKEFELVDAEREVIASDIADLDEAAWDAYRKKIDVLLAAKKKCAKTAKAAAPQNKEEKTEKKDNPKEEKMEAKASTEDNKATVDAALENAKQEKEKLAAAATAEQKSKFEEYSQAFALTEWVSDIKLTE